MSRQINLSIAHKSEKVSTFVSVQDTEEVILFNILNCCTTTKGSLRHEHLVNFSKVEIRVHWSKKVVQSCHDHYAFREGHTPLIKFQIERIWPVIHFHKVHENRLLMSILCSCFISLFAKKIYKNVFLDVSLHHICLLSFVETTFNQNAITHQDCFLHFF